MRRKMKTWLALAIMAAGISYSMGMTAFAQTDAATGQNTEVTAETIVTEGENAGRTGNASQQGATPFSVPGNGGLLDDKTNDDTKRFLTIQTKSGNTFFLVLDHSSDAENVYMLSMIDENDLAEFTEEKEKPSIVLPETETTPAAEDQKTTDKQDKKPSENRKSAIFAILLLILAVSGAAYYFKAVKPKKAETRTEEEGLEFYDGERFHVDQEEPDEIEEERETL